MDEKYKQSEANVRQLHHALKLAYITLGEKGYAYEGLKAWEQMDTIKAALDHCKPDKVTDEI